MYKIVENEVNTVKELMEIEWKAQIPLSALNGLALPQEFIHRLKGDILNHNKYYSLKATKERARWQIEMQKDLKKRGIDFFSIKKI